jgi:hypothetical protein
MHTVASHLPLPLPLLCRVAIELECEASAPLPFTSATCGLGVEDVRQVIRLIESWYMRHDGGAAHDDIGREVGWQPSLLPIRDLRPVILKPRPIAQSQEEEQGKCCWPTTPEKSDSRSSLPTRSHTVTLKQP